MINISRSKDTQAMKSEQLIEYNRNIFREKSYTKCGGVTIPIWFIQKVCSSCWGGGGEGGGEGSLKSELKQKGGRGGSSLSVHSLYEKIA